MNALLVCDLDGTLIDSFPGVAAALQHACSRAGIEPVVAIDRSIVGPPLDALLRTVAGKADLVTLAELRRAFLEAYDGGACCLAKPFEGVDEMLRTLLTHRYALALATNKRLLPTHKIIHYLGWAGLFRAVETPDSTPTRLQSKAAMLEKLCREAGKSRSSVFYLGDSDGDVEAAHAAGISCVLASWGYGGNAGQYADYMAATPLAVPEVLTRAITKI